MLQVYGNKDAFLQKGIVQGLKHIYKNEGFAGLFKGMSLTWIKGTWCCRLGRSLNVELFCELVAFRADGCRSFICTQ